MRAAAIYAETVRRSRAPVFYGAFAVADTTDGRFDLLTLHLWLVLARLAEAGLGETADALIDAAFSGFEAALREQGAGDGAVVTGLKRFAEAFYGRLAAYNAAGAGELAHALQRNLYRTSDDGETAAAGAMARYALDVKRRLAAWMPLISSLDFGPLPG
jgi:cytochrome b pre-mRNA-processing protein 3